jgi:3',5'-cyclic AMP phosphodiesterase CpdA
LASVGACSQGNISGQLAATHFGDLSNPSAERQDGRLALRAACGEPPARDATSPGLRAPFLQQVTDGSATLVWVAADPHPSVVLSTSEGSDLGTVAAALDSTAQVPAGEVQWTEPLGALAPDTTYCYSVDAAHAGRVGFRTAPAPGRGTPVRFIAFGDSGYGGSDQLALRDQMGTVPFDFMIHTGDIAYDTGTRDELQKYFFDVYADFLGQFPVFPASGNHEYGTEDAAPFREAFVLPENGGEEGKERWYSFNWGDVHFVALDTERTGQAQADWLDADLSANSLPWTIVYGHKPPFSSGERGGDSDFRTTFTPVLEKHHVPLVLNGHEHDYERTTPQNGVTYVVTGGGGRGVRPVGSSSFTAFSDAVIHFVYVTVAGAELELHAIDGLGQEFDSLVIRR